MHFLLPFSCLAVLSRFVVYPSTVELPNVEQFRVVPTAIGKRYLFESTKF